MPRRGSYYCSGCITVQASGEIPAVEQCIECASQFKKLRKLQTRIVRERPHLGRLRPADLFEKLYETLLTREKENR